MTHLDTIDWERLRALPALCLHRTLLLGLADPVPMPSPMSEAEGAWVREHVWPAAMRGLDAGYPFGFHRWCLCQHGTCWNCLNRRCDLCVHRQQRGPDVDDRDPSHWITGPRGAVIAPIVLREGQQPCRWVCRCPCAKTGPAPRNPRPCRETGPARSPERVPQAEPGQPALFTLEMP
ncbi:DUF6248 family natural product biosynthesis protein [Actinomadura sp. 3N508]|uniref:DUF6248 family natural product biosynthesis protein n=1 Tax=Actinomadura sp. 3N508 TaxID=3375153 RepID=UPI0037AEF1FA